MNDIATPSCEHANRCHCGESHRLRITLESATKTAREGEALRNAKIARLRGVVNTLLATMEMQEQRESGAFHISQPTAKHIWDTAKQEACVAMSEELL